MMVIGYDGSRAFPSTRALTELSRMSSGQVNRTGTENYSYQLLLNLSKIDRKNQYIVYLRPGTKETQKWPDNFRFSTINFPRLWTQGGLSLQTFKDPLDVLFVPAHTLPIIRKPGLRTVVTVHDLGSDYLPSMHQLKQRLYLSIMQRYQLKGATKIIAVSEATKEDLVERIGVEPLKVEVVYEGYDKELFRSVKGEILRNTLKYFDIEEGKYFLFVGTVQPRKNLERVIKAFFAIARSKATKQSSQGKIPGKIAVLPEFTPSEVEGVARNDVVELVIVGQKGWLSDDIYKLPKRLGIENKVKFLGYVPDKDLPALYSGAVALLFPSLFEGFGLPILEAQACGCPVITSNLSSMPEVAGKGAIYVNPYSTEDIIRGIGGIREKVIKAGFENVKRFSWEKCARETRAVLEKIAKMC